MLALAFEEISVITDELERYIAEGITDIGISTALEWWFNIA